MKGRRLEDDVGEGPPSSHRGEVDLPLGAKIAPQHRSLLAGWTRLSLDENGEISNDESDRPYGLYCANTRLLSGLCLLVDGKRPRRTLTCNIGPDSWFGTFIAGGSPDHGQLAAGKRPEGTLELRVGRRVGGGLREAWWLTNYAAEPRQVRLELCLEARIGEEAALGEGDDDPVLPSLERAGAPELPVLRFVRVFGSRRLTPTAELARLVDRAPRDGEQVRRGLRVRVDPATFDGRSTRVVARRDGPGLTITVELPPHGEWHLALELRPIIDELELASPDWASRLGTPADDPELELANPVVALAALRAKSDLLALDLPVLFSREGPHLLSAGIPRYVGQFGRDSLCAAWQAALFSRRWMEPTLERLARLQARCRDDFRAEAPDKLPHERRIGPDGALGRSHAELFYGDITSTPLWVFVLANAYFWSGERALIDRHFDTAAHCIAWVDRELERGDGLLWDRPIAGSHSRNHGWKDSGDAIVDGKGRIHEPPLALVEAQGYAYLALVSFAALQQARGHAGEAARYRERAQALKARFDPLFWMPERRFYALALDGDGQTIDAVSSNPGHALGCGIVPAARVPEVVARLMAPELFSGWGVRTLSSDNPAYDPFSYHRGSVWPAENAIIAASMAWWGHHAEAARIIDAQLTAASLFDQLRLPEVFGGQPRDAAHPLPGMYPQANPLQAWSASAVALFMQTLLGLRPLAPERKLLVDPHLPDWLPELTVRRLVVGQARVSLRFCRQADGRTRWEILDQTGPLAVELPA